MDGYAVRSADCAVPGVELPVSQRIPAGSVGAPLAISVARIFTGAPIPAGADAVVMQEDVVPGNGPDQVRIGSTPSAGQWIRRAGEDVARGDVVLVRGRRLTPAALGLAASVGLDRLQVARRPRVALLSTAARSRRPAACAGPRPPRRSGARRSRR